VIRRRRQVAGTMDLPPAVNQVNMVNEVPFSQPAAVPAGGRRMDRQKMSHEGTKSRRRQIKEFARMRASSKVGGASSSPCVAGICWLRPIPADVISRRRGSKMLPPLWEVRRDCDCAARMPRVCNGVAEALQGCRGDLARSHEEGGRAFDSPEGGPLSSGWF